MKPTQPCADQVPFLTEALAGTLDAEAHARLDAHLATCAACAEAHRASTETLALVKSRTRPAPPAGFFEAYADRLDERIAAEEARRPVAPVALIAPVAQLAGWARRIGAALLPPPRVAWQLAAAVMLVAVGVVIGRMGEERPGPEAGLGLPAGAGSVEAVALEERTHAYLGRSKTLLLGLVNFDPATDDPGGLNWPHRQALAAEMVEEARLLRSALTESDLERLGALVTDLEVILLQIANLEAAYDLPSIEMVRSGVDRKALLFKINVETLRRGEDAPRPAPSAPTDAGI